MALLHCSQTAVQRLAKASLARGYIHQQQTRWMSNRWNCSRPEQPVLQRNYSTSRCLMNGEPTTVSSASNESNANLPLSGTLVVSLEQAIAGPFCTRQLADLGARVIKIERPGQGDFNRRMQLRLRRHGVSIKACRLPHIQNKN